MIHLDFFLQLSLIYVAQFHLHFLTFIWLSEKFCNILVGASLRHVYQVNKVVPTVEVTSCGW